MTGFHEEPAPYSAGRMTKAAFLAWNQDREGPKCELKDGEIVMHPGISRDHNRVTLGFANTLRRLLAFDDWDIATNDFGVEIGDDIRYPDVLVERRAVDGSAYTTLEPVLPVEVLSPSSAGRDLRLKAQEYQSLPSLEAYVVASQDEAICWVWLRDSGRSFAKEPTEIAGRHGVIELPALGPSLPLAEIYRGVGAA